MHTLNAATNEKEKKKENRNCLQILNMTKWDPKCNINKELVL